MPCVLYDEMNNILLRKLDVCCNMLPGSRFDAGGNVVPEQAWPFVWSEWIIAAVLLPGIHDGGWGLLATLGLGLCFSRL